MRVHGDPEHALLLEEADRFYQQAYPDALRVLEKYWRPAPGRFGGVMHCFSGSPEEAVRAVDAGLALGVDGPITYPKNDGLRRSVLAAG